jgi:hypothetical protein
MPFASPEIINQGLIGAFHLFFVLAAFLYTIVAVLMIRQIGLMKKTLITPLNFPLITLLGLAHLGLSIWVLIFYIFAL